MSLVACESLGGEADHDRILGRISPILSRVHIFVQLALIQMQRKGKNQPQTDSSACSGVYVVPENRPWPVRSRTSDPGLEGERGRV